MYNMLMELLVKYVFKSELVHRKILDLAASTDNKIDDIAAPALIAAMKSIAVSLGKK
jgi:hypothetical protein